MTDHTEIEPREADIAAIRSFNRFYTRHLGVLDERLLESPFTLAECRILYELGTRSSATASELSSGLGMDPAYLSRLLARLRDRDMVEAGASGTDGRTRLLSLSAAGRSAFQALDRASHDEIAAGLAPLGAEGARSLVAAMRTIRLLLDPGAARVQPWMIRPHRSGDIGWIVRRQGMLYTQEHGWDESFEGLVAEIAGAFLRSHDPRRERCWIAERGGTIMGSVMLVDGGEGDAKLRLLYVEPEARGAGIGRRLVEECIAFARQAGYRNLTLWTNDILRAARRIYEAAGFVLVSEEDHHSFGKNLVGQYWRLEL